MSEKKTGNSDKYRAGGTGLFDPETGEISPLNKVNNYGSVISTNHYFMIKERTDVFKDKIETEINDVKSKLLRLIPFKESLVNLMYLRSISGKRSLKEGRLISELLLKNKGEGAERKNQIKAEANFSFPFGGLKVGSFPIPAVQNEHNENKISLETEMKKINQLEYLIIEKSEEKEKRNEAIAEFNIIKDKVSIEINRLSASFNQIIYSITHHSKFLDTISTKIGHKHHSQEAHIHTKIVSELESKIDIKKITDATFDILSKEGIGNLGILIEIEVRRIAVERLLSLDIKQQNNTTAFVISYILVVIIIFALLLYFNIISNYIPQNSIFVSVVIWSIIGSFASMLYRFNRNPIYDFGNAIKWLITRPIQGLVLGAALYLILISGQYFFTGKTEGFNDNQEIILFISFLIGFSDKFTENTINILINKYSLNSKQEQT